MYYVYILQSLKNKSLYIGYTTDLKQRFEEHNNGKSLATKPFRPYKLIFYEAFLNQKDAKSREEYLKSGWGLRSIKKMLKDYFYLSAGRQVERPRHLVSGTTKNPEFVPELLVLDRDSPPS